MIDRHVSEGRGERVAIRTPDRSLTYAQLAEQVNRAGNVFRSLGVGIDDRVVLLLPDGPAWVAAFFGAIKIGAVAVPVNTRLSATEYASILSDSGARVLLTDAALQPALAETGDLTVLVSNAAPPPSPLPRGGGDGNENPSGEVASVQPAAVQAPGTQGASFEDLMAAASSELEEKPRSADDMAFWLYTSGTTGFPKAAVHCHRTLSAGAAYGSGVLRVTDQDRFFATSKLFFAYALGNVLLIPLMVGAEAYLSPGWADPRGVADVLATYRPTLFFSVPTFYARLLQASSSLPTDAFASVRLCVSAGERLPPEISTAFTERFGVPILDGIGATETIFMFLSNTPERVRPGSSGVPVPGTAVRITTPEGAAAADREQGVLWIRTASLASGYWQRPDITADNFQDEWYRTRDLYYRDAEGSYFHCGREDDSFKVAGMWVLPTALEQAFMNHAAVLEVGAVGVEDERGLVKPFVFVVPRDISSDPAALSGELDAAISPLLPTHQRPRGIIVVGELPRTATGKLQRYKLKEHVLSTLGSAHV